MESDFDFYTRRAGEERRAAEAATHPEARDRHRALAEEYAARAGQAAEQDGARQAEPVVPITAATSEQ